LGLRHDRVCIGNATKCMVHVRINNYLEMHLVINRCGIALVKRKGLETFS